MTTPITKKTARQRWEARQNHIWKTRGLARVLCEMA